MNREVVVRNGMEAFKRNRVAAYLLKVAPVDMNQLWEMFGIDLFTLEEMKEFYQIIGYPTGGYEEIFEKYDNEDYTSQ